jgi:hypothetical protein
MYQSKLTTFQKAKAAVYGNGMVGSCIAHPCPTLTAGSGQIYLECVNCAAHHAHEDQLIELINTLGELAHESNRHPPD